MVEQEIMVREFKKIENMNFLMEREFKIFYMYKEIFTLLAV